MSRRFAPRFPAANRATPSGATVALPLHRNRSTFPARHALSLPMLQPLPGQVWSHQISDSSMLSVIRVAGRLTFQGPRPDHYALLLDNVPIMPPFTSFAGTMLYVMREWTAEGVVTRP